MSWWMVWKADATSHLRALPYTTYVLYKAEMRISVKNPRILHDTQEVRLVGTDS